MIKSFQNRNATNLLVRFGSKRLWLLVTFLNRPQISTAVPETHTGGKPNGVSFGLCASAWAPCVAPRHGDESNPISGFLGEPDRRRGWPCLGVSYQSLYPAIGWTHPHLDVLVFFVCFSFRGPLSRPFCEIVGQLRDPQRVQQPDLQPGALPGSGSLEPVPLQGRRRPRDWNAISRSRPTLPSLDHGLNGSRQVENGNRDRKSAMQK